MVVTVTEHGNGNAWPPIGAPLNVHRDEHWTNFDSSVNAVSFGFVATAILISMFLLMAIFERFLRPTSPPLSPDPRRSRRDVEAQIGFSGKLAHPSPKVSQSQQPFRSKSLKVVYSLSGACFQSFLIALRMLDLGPFSNFSNFFSLDVLLSIKFLRDD